MKNRLNEISSIDELKGMSTWVRVLQILCVGYCIWAAIQFWPDYVTIIYRIFFATLAVVVFGWLGVTGYWLFKWFSTGDSSWPLMIPTPWDDIKTWFKSLNQPAFGGKKRADFRSYGVRSYGVRVQCQSKPGKARYWPN